MKALIISDDESPVPQIAASLHAHGYETIQYKWLIKALDNVAEIDPDLTVINVRDYPRHWKVFAQFARNDGKAADIILYAPVPLSDSEQAKAAAIGIKGCFSFDGQGAAEFSGLLDRLRASPAPSESAADIPQQEAVPTEDVPIPSVDDLLAPEAECGVPAAASAGDEAEPSAEDSPAIPSVDEIAQAPAASLQADDGGRPAGACQKPAPDDDADALIPSVDMFADSAAAPEPAPSSEGDDFSEEEGSAGPEEVVAIPSVGVVAVGEAFIPSVDVVAVGDAPILSVDDCCCEECEEIGQGKAGQKKSLLRKIEQLYEKK